MGKTPALIEKVPPDFYEVMLTQEGYDDVFERVLVKAGKTASISKKLRVNERVYSISSSPSGANVYLDGKYKGITPVVFHAGEGQHKLAIKKTGYSTISKEINASGETAPVMEEKLHLNLVTYFAATLVLLAAGIIIKRNPEKLKFKFPRKVSAGGRALEKFQRGSGKRDEKLQEKSSVPDDLVELENFTEQNFEYTVKKKKKV